MGPCPALIIYYPHTVSTLFNLFCDVMNGEVHLRSLTDLLRCQCNRGDEPDVVLSCNDLEITHVV